VSGRRILSLNKVLASLKGSRGTRGVCEEKSEKRRELTFLGALKSRERIEKRRKKEEYRGRERKARSFSKYESY